MISNNATVAPRPAALPPAATALPSGNGSASVNGQSFTQFLSEQPSMQPPPAQAEPAPTKPEAPPQPAPQAPPAPDGPDPNTTRLNRDRGLVKKPVTPIKVGPDTAAASAAKTDKAAAARKDVDATTDAKLDTDKADTTDDAPETSGLTEFTQLIGLATPAQAAAPADATVAATAASLLQATQAEHASRGRSDAAADDDTDTAVRADASDTRTGRQPTERRPDAPIRLADASQRGKPVEAFGDKPDGRSVAASPTDALQTAPAATASTPPQTAATPGAGTPNFAALLAQGLPGHAAPADLTTVSGTAYGQVQAPVHSSAFGAELGARVSLLAVDGLQTAELQLNPADMGPVAVQIVVDGSQAQVSFHAAQAETRQALEQSMPDLAAALKGQGLTLSGGGVFQQAPRDANPSAGAAGDDQPARRTSRVGGGVDSSAAAGASTPTRRTVGLLDTFA
ncbi:flagellar hook-length control protein FliK [Roseateles sp.]|uniref:flagellar hook-length control protein FliK n=1 Tax=Roseateles sp. TaxID=1971397 RepID=UPI003BA895DD